jgi:ribosomal protein L24E
MVMQREYMGVYPGSGKRRPYVQRGGRVLYFLAPKCLRRGYKPREREPVPSLKGRVQWLEMLISKVGKMSISFFSSIVLGEFLALPFYRLKGRVRFTTKPRGALVDKAEWAL